MNKADKLVKDFELLGGRDVDLLVKLLQDYEVVERCTAIALDNSSNYSLLKREIGSVFGYKRGL